MIMSITNSPTMLFHSLHVNLRDGEAVSGKVSPLMVSKAVEQLQMPRSKAVVGFANFTNIYTDTSCLQTRTLRT